MGIPTRRHQLKEAIKRDIIARGLTKGDAIPSERHLAEMYDISRVTVRRAIADLIEEGFLLAEGRRGTFVNEVIEQGQPASEPRKRLIGVILSTIRSASAAALINAVDRQSNELGYSVSVTSTDEDPIKAEQHVQRLAAAGAAGLIYLPCAGENFSVTNTKVLNRARAAGLPVVFIDRYFPGSMVDTVVSDNFDGAYRATEHLISKGHRHIGFISIISCSSAEDRIAGYRKCLMDHGIHPDERVVLRIAPQVLEDDIKTAVSALLRVEPAVTAVFALHDLIAMRLWKEYNARGLRVPEDVAIVGYDNTAGRDAPVPYLTTTEQPLAEEGSTAVRMLVDRIDGYTGEARFVVLKSSLVLGRSTGDENGAPAASEKIATDAGN